jgi:hypothetical protein
VRGRPHAWSPRGSRSVYRAEDGAEIASCTSDEAVAAARRLLGGFESSRPETEPETLPGSEPYDLSIPLDRWLDDRDFPALRKNSFTSAHLSRKR